MRSLLFVIFAFTVVFISYHLLNGAFDVQASFNLDIHTPAGMISGIKNAELASQPLDIMY